MGLKPRPEALLFSVVSRLTEQKGLHLLPAVVDELVQRGGQLAVLGSGDAGIEQALRDCAQRHPGQVALTVGYDEALAHSVIAGADVILLPSRFEPCGLTQLYGLRYGTLPLVRAVGGLADTVVDCSLEHLDDGSASGFVFQDLDVPEPARGAASAPLRCSAARPTGAPCSATPWRCASAGSARRASTCRSTARCCPPERHASTLIASALQPPPRAQRHARPPCSHIEPVPFEYDHLDNGVDALRKSIANRLVYSVGRDPRSATRRDWLFALFHAVRDRMMHRWRETLATAQDDDAKRVYYLSMEFLTGRALTNALLSVGILDEARTACTQLGVDFDSLIDLEADAGLGNGGLGRLAACFLDSMATLGIPGMGYGIRYDYGMFAQTHRRRPPGGRARLLAGQRQPLGIHAPGVQLHGAVRRAPGAGGRRRALGRDRRRDRHRLRHRRARPRAQQRRHHAPVVRARHQRHQPGRLQQGRLHARGGGQERIGKRLARALPRRQHRARQGAAPAPGVLLRQRLAAGHRAPLQEAPGQLRPVRRPRGDPPQRHPPRAGRARAHAPAGGRARPGVGHRLGHLQKRLQLHQPHADAGGAGDLAGGADGPPAAAPPAHHLRPERDLSGRGARAFSGRERPAAPRVVDRRTRPAPRAHGLPRRCWPATRSTASRRCTAS